LYVLPAMLADPVCPSFIGARGQTPLLSNSLRGRSLVFEDQFVKQFILRSRSAQRHCNHSNVVFSAPFFQHSTDLFAETGSLQFGTYHTDKSG
jgi:hypothetical protein